jgi:hypothetical protein
LQGHVPCRVARHPRIRGIRPDVGRIRGFRVSFPRSGVAGSRCRAAGLKRNSAGGLDGLIDRVV